jgi:hypothetical protein
MSYNCSPLPLFWSSSCTLARLGAMDANQTSGLFDLDQEKDILRSLAARTPSFPRRSTVKIEEENRNDAVVGSSGFSELPEGLSSGQTNRSQRAFTPQENFQGAQEDPRLMDKKFVSVDDLSLNPEDPAQRRYAASEILGRLGDRQNQYFPRGEIRSDSSGGDFLGHQRRVSQLNVSGLGSGELHFPIHTDVFTGGGDHSICE